MLGGEHLVKRIVLVLDDLVFDKLKKRKRRRTWEQMLVEPLIREKEPKHRKEIMLGTAAVTKTDTKKQSKIDTKIQSK